MKTWQPVLAALLVVSAAAQPRRVVPLGSSGKRVALVVGNGNYRSLPRLTNSVRDAQAMGTALADAGFQVIPLIDASREALDEGVNRFIAAIQPGDVAMFYYSGHAVQIGGENYLSPVDLQVVNAVQARDRSLRAGEVVEEMESRGADLQIVVLDACRDNPFGTQRSIGGGGGLAAMSAGRGTFLAFATAPGRTADDNSAGQNGLYTTYLLKAIAQRGLSLEQVFKQASADVQSVSGGKQVPWIASSMQGDFYFHGGDSAATVPGPTPAPRVDAATETWALIKESTNAEDFESFAQAYPNSDLAAGARIRAAQLRRTVTVAAVPASAPETARIPSSSGIAAGTTKVNPKDGLTYVWIPPGTFTMGCSPGDNECNDWEKPAHQVTITKGFWLGQTDVTQAAYQRVTGQDPSNFKGANLPVEQVNWDEADSYCREIGGRLPAEAEWEYAARAGSTGRRYGNGGRYGDIDPIAWYIGNSGGKTHEVGQKQPNAWGLYDMLGNVWQWMSDWYGDHPPAGTTDPTGPSSGQYRVLRGGSWYVNPGDVRVSGRDWNDPAGRSVNYGLRCVWE